MSRVEVDRRHILKLVMGGTSMAGIAALGANEAQAFHAGIETDNGIFTPLYELHSRHVTPDKMPSGTNIYFTEITSIHGRELFEADPFEVADNALQGYKDFLSQNNTELMVGDVFFNEPTMSASFAIPAAEHIGGVSIAAKTKTLPWQIGTEKEDDKRRRIVKIAGAAVAYWLMSPIMVNSVGGALSILTNNDQNNIPARIATRLAALQQHLHPEFSVSVFRSLVMADKLLEVAKDYREKTGRKARIAFNVGLGHAQIEDFLQVGQDVCRRLITLHPQPILKSSIDHSDGLDNFCTARLFKVSVTQGLVEVEERKVIDQELRGQLEYLSKAA